MFREIRAVLKGKWLEAKPRVLQPSSKEFGVIWSTNLVPSCYIFRRVWAERDDFRKSIAWKSEGADTESVVRSPLAEATEARWLPREVHGTRHRTRRRTLRPVLLRLHRSATRRYQRNPRKVHRNQVSVTQFWVQNYFVGFDLCREADGLYHFAEENSNLEWREQSLLAPKLLRRKN